jgi:hypothetical protein
VFILDLIQLAFIIQRSIFIKIIKEALLQTLAEGLGNQFKSANRTAWSNIIDYFGFQMFKTVI